MSTENATSPEAGGAAGVAAEGVADQVAQAPADDIDTEAFDRQDVPDDEPDPDAADGAAEGEGEADDKPTDAELFEIEAEDGEKVKVPAKLKDMFLRQAAFTQKTQDLAAQRRTVEEQAAALEAERTQTAESLAELRADHIRVGVIEQTIEQAKAILDQQVDRSGLKLKDVDWPAYRRVVADLPADDEDRLTYERLRKVYDGAETDLADLTRQLGKVKEDLQTKESARLTKQQEAAEAALAKQRQETGRVLAAEVEGWNKEAAVKTVEFAREHLGITPEEMFDAIDPRLWKALHGYRTALAENASLKTALKQQKAADNNVQAQKTVPAATPKGGGGDPTRLRDDIGTKAWMERRNRAVAGGR